MAPYYFPLPTLNEMVQQCILSVARFASVRPRYSNLVEAFIGRLQLMDNLVPVHPCILTHWGHTQVPPYIPPLDGRPFRFNTQRSGASLCRCIIKHGPVDSPSVTPRRFDDLLLRQVSSLPIEFIEVVQSGRSFPLNRWVSRWLGHPPSLQPSCCNSSHVLEQSQHSYYEEHPGIRSPDRPARSQSLYRLSYPAHVLIGGLILIITD
jgi:hypothetical protein